MTLKQKKLRYECYKCDKRFKSWQERDEHCKYGHPEPRKIIKEIKRYNDYHSLIGGKELKLGDKIIFTKIGIITKIVETEGNPNVQIEVAVISDVYNKD